MKDLGALMKQAQAMQQKLTEAQAKLAEMTADGVAGVRIAVTPLAKQSSKSFLIRVRTFCARR